MKYLTTYPGPPPSAQSNDALTTPKASDSTVRSLAKKRSQQWVESLYREHKVNLCGWLRKRYPQADVEELAHKAYAKLLELDSIDHIHNPKAFLYTTAVNFALLEVRSRATSQKYIDRELHNASRNVEEITPERIYSSSARFQQIIQGMERLSVKQRQVLHLSRIEGKTYEQIQHQMGWSLADISRQITQAMALIREELANQSAAKDDN